MENVTIYQLLESRTITVRSFNICQANNLLDVESLLAYYLAHGDFRQFRHIGLKSNLELIKCCEEYMANKNEQPGMRVSEKPMMAARQHDAELVLTPIQQSYLDLLTLHHFQSLSLRARNYLSSSLGDQVTAAALYRFFAKNLSPLILQIPNMGTKTKSAIKLYALKIFQLRNDIANTEVSKIKKNLFNSWLNLAFSIKSIGAGDIEQSYIEGRLKLFALIDILIDSRKVFSKGGTHVFEKRFGYYEGIPAQYLHEIGDELGLTRERIRQLEWKTKKYFEVCMEKLATLPGSLDHIGDYGWELGDDSFFVTPESAYAVSRAEKIRFTQRFYTLFLWAQAKGSYQILPIEINGIEYDILVKSDLYEAFDFLAFLKDSGRVIPMKIRKTYFINFEEYLSAFLQNEKSYHLLPRLKQICRELLLAQFKESVPFDADGNLSFENHLKGPNLQALAFQLLESENRPMHVNEIYERLKDYPNYLPLKGNYIKNHLLSDKERFIYFERTFTFGLQKWEAQNKTIKGGTIQKIAEEYLEKFDHPKHILEITDYIKQYRPNTSERSIVEIFRVDKTQNILPFPDKHWGLSSKNYAAEIEIEPRKLPYRIEQYLLQYLVKNGEVSIEQLMSHFTQSYNLSENQLDAKLEAMLQRGLLQISDEGMVQVC